MEFFQAGEATAPQRRAHRGWGAAYVPAEDGDDPVQATLEVPIFRGGGVVFGDENHRKTKLGRATKHERRIRRDGAGNVAPKERRGVLQKKTRMMTEDI